MTDPSRGTPWPGESAESLRQSARAEQMPEPDRLRQTRTGWDMTFPPEFAPITRAALPTSAGSTRPGQPLEQPEPASTRAQRGAVVRRRAALVAVAGLVLAVAALVIAPVTGGGQRDDVRASSDREVQDSPDDAGLPLTDDEADDGDETGPGDGTGSEGGDGSGDQPGLGEDTAPDDEADAGDDTTPSPEPADRDRDRPGLVEDPPTTPAARKPTPETGGTRPAAPVASPTQTPAPQRLISYNVVNLSSGRCVGVTGDPRRKGADVTQQACTATASRWIIQPTRDGYFRLTNRVSGQVLDLGACRAANGANVQTWPWLANNCQQWKLIRTSDGYFRLMNRSSSKALDVAACGAAVGVDIQQWEWLNNRCQQFRLRPVGKIAILNVHTGKAVDVAACRTGLGATVQQWKWLGSKCQKWMFTHVNSGYYRIHPTSAPDKCLVIKGNAKADGGVAQQGACTGTNSQWRLEPRPQGGVRLVARHSGKSFDLNGCQGANGARLQQWRWLSNPCQRFYLRYA
ncbi:hypothetical protein GCM10027290_51280 [Micromonospora sonneratiae]|uniref:RICIN domain-containing protein n=1 Tax=Micromonospora sonneratiae TaxID=1184706 RepID=A0ABW3YBZ0_9ACTN